MHMRRNEGVVGYILLTILGTAFGNESMDGILQYLKTHGERLDTEIAEAVGVSLANVRQSLSELTAKGEVISCHLIRFEQGVKIEGMSCRLAGFTPPAAPGRKSKAQSTLS